MVMTVEEKRASDRVKSLRWFHRNKDKAKAYQRSWRAANPEKVRLSQRRNHIKRRYGLTEQDWQGMFQAQGEACACCGSRDRGTVKDWHVDHSHATGRVRGILCHPCNLVLAVSKEDSSRLLGAVEYLRASALSEMSKPQTEATSQ